MQVESKGSVSVLMTQERPGSTARGPQHVMMKLQIYNTSPHFGKGIVSIMMLVRQGSSLRAACAQMGLSYSKAWRLLKSAEADLGIPLLDTQKGGTKRAGSTQKGSAGRHCHFDTLFNKTWRNIPDSSPTRIRGALSCRNRRARSCGPGSPHKFSGAVPPAAGTCSAAGPAG